MNPEISLFYVLSLALVVVFSTQPNAQQFDQSYLKWKAKQEQADAKLRANDPNYYLSKPSLSKQSLSHAYSSTAQFKPSSAPQSQTLLSSAEKIRINSASVIELQQLNGIGEKKAQLIIEYRSQHGKFKNIDELQNIKGIGPKLVEKNRTRLTL